MYEPIGYYVTCDDAYCADCFDGEHYTSDGLPWEGFEGWEEPLPIFLDTESDTPTHCARCEALIEHALTGEGYAYVTEAIIRELAHDAPSGRPCILKAWYEEYGEGIADTISERVAMWPDSDQYSPTARKA